jgi:hypothetical protein
MHFKTQKNDPPSMISSCRRAALFFTLVLASVPGAQAASPDAIAQGLVPHKALYDIDLVATHSGSQVINISGHMSYEWKPSCDAWLTDHHFKLFYEYADAPGMRIASDFSTYETANGDLFNYSSRRQRDGDMYQEIRGQADMGVKGGKARYTLPEKLSFDLKEGALFPIGHTVELIRHAQAGEKFYTAEVFDGSDEDGPIEISSFIGKKIDADKSVSKNPKIDETLLKVPAWNVRMAIFPVKDQEEESDYEMSMVFLENGIIADMVIEYDDFSVKQKLVALQKIPADGCDPGVPIPKKP